MTFEFARFDVIDVVFQALLPFLSFPYSKSINYCEYLLYVAVQSLLHHSLLQRKEHMINDHCHEDDRSPTFEGVGRFHSVV